MKLDSYLSFNGDCRQAFDFYAQALGGKIVAMMTFGETPGCEGMPEAKDKIMHAAMELGGRMVMGTDATPLHPYDGIRGSYLVIDTQEIEEANRLFAALAEGGKIEMDIQETFFAKRYGITVDRFGVPWMIICTDCAPA